MAFPRRAWLLGLTLLIAVFAASGISAVPPEVQPRADGAASAPVPEASDRLREGTRLDGLQGTFKATGDRWTFFTSDGARRFGVLENLALERVERMIRENSQAVEWSISGVITEHQGANYLLVTRAVLKSRSQQP